MEITNYKTLNKGALQASFNLKIPSWRNFIIREMSYFKMNGKRWVSLPARQYEKDGEKKYFSYNLFEDQKDMYAFSEEVLKVLDKFLLTQNSMPQDEEIPF